MSIIVSHWFQLSAAPVSVAVPEPGRIVGLFGMAGMMGLGLFWQRRRSAALNV